MALKRDYYTIEETANSIGGYSLNDIYHFIETRKIKPALYTAKRRYIAVTWDTKSRQLTAHATCLYQGLLQTHNDNIDNLLDKGIITLRTASKPLSPDNISHWDARYPYKNKKPNLAFLTWHSCPSINESILKESIYLIPFATERKSLLRAFQEALEISAKTSTIASDLLKKNQLVNNEASETQNYTYNFQENGTFSKDSLRLTQENIATLTDKKKTINNPIKHISEEPSPWSTSKKGGDLINEKIEHTYRQNHTEPTTQLWRKMETLYNENHFDSVIDRITPDEISWVSRKKVEKITTYNAFEKKVSQIRVFYRKNNIQIQK